MISARLLIYAALFAGGAVAVWLYGESREEDGYNRAVAEHSEAMAEWHQLQEADYQKALAEERRRAVLLSDELSQLRGDFEALQSEVSHVIKPALPDQPDCTGWNPLAPDFGRMFNEGARGGSRDTTSAADPGNGEVSRAPAHGSR